MFSKMSVALTMMKANSWCSDMATMAALRFLLGLETNKMENCNHSAILFQLYWWLIQIIISPSLANQTFLPQTWTRCHRNRHSPAPGIDVCRKWGWIFKRKVTFCLNYSTTKQLKFRWYQASDWPARGSLRMLMFRRSRVWRRLTELRSALSGGSRSDTLFSILLSLSTRASPCHTLVDQGMRWSRWSSSGSTTNTSCWQQKLVCSEIKKEQDSPQPKDTGVGGGGVQAHPQKVWFDESPKICGNLGKMCENFFAKSLYAVWYYKNGTQNKRADVFFEGHVFI